MLDAEAEHYDFSFAFGEGDGGGFAFESFGALGVAGNQDVLGVRGIPGDDGAFDAGRGIGGLKGYGCIHERGYFSRQTVAYGVIGVEINAQERSGDIEVGVGRGFSRLRRQPRCGRED